jgi:hypothetical protein
MSRKLKVETILDLDEGSYELKFHRLSNPEFEIEWNEIKHILNKIFSSVEKQLDESGVNSTEQVTKIIH